MAIVPGEIVDEQNTYVSPDIMVFLGEKGVELDLDQPIRSIPDLVVEVLSPSTTRHDLVTKRDAYARLGVAHYWILDPPGQRASELVLSTPGPYDERTIKSGESFRPTIFPDLDLDLAQLFR